LSRFRMESTDCSNCIACMPIKMQEGARRVKEVSPRDGGNAETPAGKTRTPEKLVALSGAND